MDVSMEIECHGEPSGAAAVPTHEDTVPHEGLDALGFDKASRRSSLGADSVLDQDFTDDDFDGGADGGSGPSLTPLDTVLSLQYAQDIFVTRKEMEISFHPLSCMADQPQVTENMRCTLVHWLTKVNQQLQFGGETVFVAVNLADRFLSLTPLAQDCLQLLAVTSLFLAAKMEESVVPSIRELVAICGGTYKHHHFIHMEVLVLSKLDFALYGPTTWYFLNHLALGASEMGAIDRRAVGLARYVTETCLSSYEVTQFLPSVQAAGALLTALKVLTSPTLTFSTHCLLNELYSEEEQEESRMCSSLMTQYMAPFLEPLSLPSSTSQPVNNDNNNNDSHHDQESDKPVLNSPHHDTHHHQDHDYHKTDPTHSHMNHRNHNSPHNHYSHETRHDFSPHPSNPPGGNHKHEQESNVSKRAATNHPTLN